MRIVLLGKDSIHLRCHIQPQQTPPEGLGAREAIALSSQMAAEAGLFGFEDVVRAIADKMVARHPHVFGDESRDKSAEQQTVDWEKLKAAERAAKAARRFIRGSDTPATALRLAVSGGGCSGLQYGFTFDENMEEGDTRVQNEGVILLVDPMSFQYLAGAEIDYSEGLEGAQFVIRNPNATTTCGCGSSFSI